MKLRFPPFFDFSQSDGLRAFVTFIAFLAMISVPLFLKLGTPVIRLYDESRNVANALEMSRDGHYLVRYIFGAPDPWETKLPLLTWLQVLSMKFFGISELAVRLPSALAAFFTCILLAATVAKASGKVILGYFSALVLVANFGYIYDHCARYGENDALLILFLISAFFSIYFYSEKPTKTLWLFLASFSLIAATLTKSIMGLSFLPAFAIFLMWKREFIPLFRKPAFYYSCLTYLVCITGFYLAREAASPGLFIASQKSEILHRNAIETGNIIGSFLTGFFYYFRIMVESQFAPWLFIVPFGIWVSLKKCTPALRSLAVFSIITIIIHFVIISCGSRNVWYDLPVFPVLSIFAGAGIYFIFEAFTEKLKSFKSPGRAFMQINLVVLIFYAPFANNIKWLEKKEDMNPEYRACYFLRNIEKERPDLKKFKVVEDAYCAHYLFYISRLNSKGFTTSLASSGDNYNEGEKLLITSEEVLAKVKEKYSLKTIYESGYGKIYEIYKLKLIFPGAS